MVQNYKSIDPAIIAGLDADYYIDYSGGTIPIGDLTIGARVVDPSWMWEFRSGWSYTRKTGDETKPVTWIVVSMDHYGSGSGVTLLAEEIIGYYSFDTRMKKKLFGMTAKTGVNHWGLSGKSDGTLGLRPWLNSTGLHSSEGFYRAFSESFKRAVLATNVPNREWEAGNDYSTSDHVFIPSTTELGDIDHNRTYPIGAAYAYFQRASDAKRVAKLGKDNQSYNTRSPFSFNGNMVLVISRADGGFTIGVAHVDITGVRPALNLKSEILVSEIKN